VKCFNNSEIFPVIAGNISRFYYVRSIITMNNVTGTFSGIWRDSEHFHVIAGNYSCNNMTFFTFKFPRYCMKNFQQ
jgi:hypothetical protein